MGEHLKGRLIERMRLVKRDLRVMPNRSISLPGEDPIALPVYAQRLEEAYRDQDTKAAWHLLAAVL